MSGRNEKKGSVRDRVPGLRKKDSRGKSQARDKVETMTKKGEVTAGGAETKMRRTPATKADYLAAQLHEAQGKLLDLRNEILGMRQQALQKDQVILQREQQILALEAREIERNKKRLRDEHGLAVGRTLEKDDETGEVFWLEPDESQK